MSHSIIRQSLVNAWSHISISIIACVDRIQTEINDLQLNHRVHGRVIAVVVSEGRTAFRYGVPGHNAIDPSIICRHNDLVDRFHATMHDGFKNLIRKMEELSLINEEQGDQSNVSGIK